MKIPVMIGILHSDRWGRILMRRREAALVRQEQRTEQKLFETDYLLGVYDGHRMGAIRIKLEEEGPFLNDNQEMASPPWTFLRDFELAMEVYEYFHLSKEQAIKIICEVKGAVRKWRNIASTFGISKGEQDLKSLAFSNAED